MASKRATNNSTIVNLEEQSSVLEEILSQGGVPVTKPPKGNSDKSKTISKKKSKKAEQTTLISTSPQTPGSSAIGQHSSRSDTPSSSGSANRRTLPSAALGSPPPEVLEVGQHGAAAANHSGSLGNELGNGAASSDGQASHAQGNAGWNGQAGVPMGAQQQQWFWQQPNNFPLHYGNFVPNYSLGGGYLVPDWDQEDPAPVGTIRQQTHEISEDEDDDLPAEQEAEAPAVETPPVGKTADLLNEQLGVVKDCDKVTPKVATVVAQLLDRYLLESTSSAEMEKLVKQFPRVDNVERMTVPRLDEEVFQVIDQKHRNSDQSLQAVQRALMASMSALSGVVDLGFRRETEDPELDELGKNILNSLQLQAFAHNALLSKRKELLKPELSPVYAKELSKGHSTSTEWLYGGDLVDATKKCEAAKKIGDKIIKRKNFPQNKGPQKRFKAPFPANFGTPYHQGAMPMLRAFNPYPVQQFRFQGPQNFQQTPAFQPTQFGGFQRRPRFPKSQGQRFGKRGGFKQ